MIAELAAAAVALSPTPATPLESTAYCLDGRMADGTHVRRGSVAHNGLKLGTHVSVSPPFGYGTQLDFWTGSCTAARRWGRRTVRLRVGWSR
jgi:hypothetical protein